MSYRKEGLFTFHNVLTGIIVATILLFLVIVISNQIEANRTWAQVESLHPTDDMSDDQRIVNLEKRVKILEDRFKVAEWQLSWK